jgi:hypothetical protein
LCQNESFCRCQIRFVAERIVLPLGKSFYDGENRFEAVIRVLKFNDRTRFACAEIATPK